MEFTNSLPELEILPAGSSRKTDLSFLSPQKKATESQYQVNLEGSKDKNDEPIEEINENEIQEERDEDEEMITFKKLKKNKLFEKAPILTEFADDKENDPSQTIPEKQSLKINTDRKPLKTQGKQVVYESYNVMLNLTDISYGVKGHNKFYLIQVLHRDGKEFTLYTKWGRVGAQNPQSNYVVFPSKYDAIVAFKRKFTDKTMNDWDHREKFVTKPGKYTMIQVDHKENADPSSVNLEIERLNKRNEVLQVKIRNSQSNLEKNVKDLMESIWDIDKMNKTLKKLRFDVDKSPLGKLSLEQIQKGYKVLTEIQKILLNGGKESALVELNNQFYTNIPHNYGMQKIPMIDQISKVREKIQLLDLLKDIDIANKFISLALKGDSTLNPLDSFYKMLKISVSLLPEDDNYYSMITEMIKNCHGSTHKYKLNIQKVYKIEKHLEKERYHAFKSLPNRYLLWHGSRLTNYVGILSEGLRIAPSDAPTTGYMFGKGVYFTEVASKAAGYCHATPENKEGVLLLCEVALGNMYQVFKAKGFKKPPKYYHSVHGVGRMQSDPKKKIQCADDVIAALGKIVNNEELEKNSLESDLIYNEYVVYDTAQICMKYLVKVSFEF